MDSFWRNLVYAARVLRQAPAFTLIAVAVLAIGIGANCAIFSLVDAVLLRPLPFSRPAETLLSNRKAKRMLGFRPAHSWRAALQQRA